MPALLTYTSKFDYFFIFIYFVTIPCISDIGKAPLSGKINYNMTTSKL